MQFLPRRPSALLALVLAALIWLPTASFANEFTVVIQGQKQGQFKGAKGGIIQLYGYEFHLGFNHDANGNITGGRKYDPIIIRKDLDVASPQILAACATNENLTSVVIQAKVPTHDGTIVQAYTITLKNARIVDIKQLPDAKGLHYEEVSIQFQSITVENGSTSVSDDSNSPG